MRLACAIRKAFVAGGSIKASGYEVGGDAVWIGVAANGSFQACDRIGGGWCGFGLWVESGGVEAGEEETKAVESRVRRRAADDIVVSFRVLQLELIEMYFW